MHSQSHYGGFDDNRGRGGGGGGGGGNDDYLADIPFVHRDPDRSPSVGSVQSREKEREKNKERGTLSLHQKVAYVGSQSGYDSSSTRSEGDIEHDFDHTTYFNSYNGQYPKVSNQSNQAQIQGRNDGQNQGSRGLSRVSPQNSYQATHALLSVGSNSDLLSTSNSGSRYGNAYSPSDYDERLMQDKVFSPFDRSPRSSMPQSSTMNNTTTGERSFQSELSDPEHQQAEDESSSQLSIPLDKWMIKAWLPIVFSGFDYDVIDSFVAQLRDNGGFVTVQDLLDAVDRDELTREALADIAGFKVGHCNRLDKALSSYHNKSIPK